jgi:hypothetical protein
MLDKDTAKKTGAGMCCLAFCCLMIWIPSLIFAVGKVNDLEGLDPENEFSLVAEQCEIIRIAHAPMESSTRRRRSTSRDYKCEDEYRYTFSLGGTVTPEFVSRMEKGLRCNAQCGQCPTQAPASFTLGATVPCWKPTVPVASVPKEYNCLNNGCCE